jgi:hypothetical protein
VVAATAGIAFAADDTSPGQLLQAARTALQEAQADDVVYRVWHPPASRT